MEICSNIGDFFADLLDDLKCREDTKSYIISIYGKFKSANDDLSKENLTLLLAKNYQRYDFLTFQQIGDFVFFANTLFPKCLRFASKNYYDSLARSSYYSCYKMMNGQWKLFEELADQFPILEEQTKNKLGNIVLR